MLSTPSLLKKLQSLRGNGKNDNNLNEELSHASATNGENPKNKLFYPENYMLMA